MGKTAGGDEVVGVVVGVLNREGEREGREFLVLVRERANERERENELNERDEGELCVDDFGL